MNIYRIGVDLTASREASRVYYVIAKNEKEAIEELHVGIEWEDTGFPGVRWAVESYVVADVEPIESDEDFELGIYDYEES